MTDGEALEREFERGRRVGHLEQTGFSGIPRSHLLPGARFRFRRSLFDSFLDYEREVLENLRQAQRLRWLRSRDRSPSDHAEDLQRIEAEIRSELWKVREAVDAEREEGRGRACAVEALRASPQMPTTVAEYSAAEFAREDERRKVRWHEDWVDLSGADFGHDWGLENPFRRWEVSRWRISWLCDDRFSWNPGEAPHGEGGSGTAEVYSVEGPRRHPADGEQRVWLLGVLRTRQAVGEALEELTRHGMRERNSLVAAANAVARVSRKEGWLVPPD
ncbi:MAG TPA: hypothetical protein VGI73_07965 [Solirubrobacterales bacterium]